jgi:hypothetical protein
MLAMQAGEGTSGAGTGRLRAVIVDGPLGGLSISYGVGLEERMVSPSTLTDRVPKVPKGEKGLLALLALPHARSLE